MATGQMVGYQGTATAAFEIVENGYEKYIKIYNDTGGALARGTVYAITFTAAASGVVYPAVVAPATVGTATCLTGVVNNSLRNETTIGIASWGYMQIAGYCPYVLTSGVVAVNAQLEVVNATPTLLIDAEVVGGAVLAGETVGIAIALITTDVWSVWLINRRHIVDDGV